MRLLYGNMDVVAPISAPMLQMVPMPAPSRAWRLGQHGLLLTDHQRPPSHQQDKHPGHRRPGKQDRQHWFLRVPSPQQDKHPHHRFHKQDRHLRQQH